MNRRPPVAAEDVVVGSKWMLHWPGELQPPFEVTVAGREETERWGGGFGVDLGPAGIVAFDVFAISAERVDDPSRVPTGHFRRGRLPSGRDPHAPMNPWAH